MANGMGQCLGNSPGKRDGPGLWDPEEGPCSRILWRAKDLGILGAPSRCAQGQPTKMHDSRRIQCVPSKATPRSPRPSRHERRTGVDADSETEACNASRMSSGARSPSSSRGPVAHRFWEWSACGARPRGGALQGELHSAARRATEVFNGQWNG